MFFVCFFFSHCILFLLQFSLKSELSRMKLQVLWNVWSNLRHLRLATLFNLFSLATTTVTSNFTSLFGLLMFLPS